MHTTAQKFEALSVILAYFVEREDKSDTLIDQGAQHGDCRTPRPHHWVVLDGIPQTVNVNVNGSARGMMGNVNGF